MNLLDVLLRGACRIRTSPSKAIGEENVAEIAGTLDALQRGDKVITVKQLKETGLGKDVGALKKHTDVHVKATASSLIKSWKKCVKQEDKA